MIFTKSISQQRGFTLVELMITVLISSIVILVISYTYSNQRKIHKRQEAVVDMQQNARAGLYLLTQEIRMAGYDPLETAGAGFAAATVSSIRYTQDINENGTINTPGPAEDVTIAFDNVNSQITRDMDGPGGVPGQPFINNVDFFELVYTLGNGIITRNPTASELNEIETIQITMVIMASSPEPDLDISLLDWDVPPSQIPDLRNPPPQGTNYDPPNDNRRRRLVSATVQCRNASL